MKTSRTFSVSTSLGLMLTVILLSGMTLSSCGNNQKATSETSAPEALPATEADQVSAKPAEVQYTIAENYFIKNGAQLPESHKITDKQTFDSIFGMATTMGEKGKPTEIDFDKSFVIAVEKGPVQKQTELVPGYLIDHYDGKLVFHYNVKTGEDISYTIRPVLIIIVDKSLAGKDITLSGHNAE